MAGKPSTVPTEMPEFRAWRVYAMAAIYLVAGLAIGYVLRLSQSPVSAARTAPMTAVSSLASVPATQKNPSPHSLSLDQMKQMADQQAAPLLARLKTDPGDSALLMQIGSIYHAAHQFAQAAAYYDKAAQADSKNAAARNKLAISLYRTGDVDGAIAQLNLTLKDNPGDANALFNLGMIRLQGKQDGKGALAAWQQLLKLNPQLSADRKAEVQKLMAGAMTAQQNRSQGGATNDRP